MYQITNKDRDDLLILLADQIERFSDLNKDKKLTGKERILCSKANYLKYRLESSKQYDKNK